MKCVVLVKLGLNTEYLSQYDIHIESHVARFGENLIERAPCLELRKVSNKLHVFTSNYIRLDIFSMKNSFSGTLNENDQVETVSSH